MSRPYSPIHNDNNQLFKKSADLIQLLKRNRCIQQEINLKKTKKENSSENNLIIINILKCQTKYIYSVGTLFDNFQPSGGHN